MRNLAWVVDEEQEARPVGLFDLEELERLVTADELQELDADCVIHDGCRPVF